jgi:hypothetical protein
MGTAGGFSSIFEVYSAVRLKILNRKGHDRSTQHQVTVSSGKKERWLSVSVHLFMPTAMLTSLAAQTAWRCTKRLLPKQCDIVGCALNMLKSKRVALERRESFQCGCCMPLPERELSLS